MSKTVLPNEPRPVSSPREQALAGRFLLPALAELEAFFYAVRAQIEPALKAAQPVKMGKPFPLGQCLEISLAAQELLSRIDPATLDEKAARGHAAYRAFLQAGGSWRQVWGDLRGEFFQNAFQLGTLYVDVANDTVTPTKPKVEILPFEQARFVPIADFRHFSRVGERYWKDRIYPNHVLPELAPYCPLVHVNQQGVAVLREASDYMLALAQAAQFRHSEDVLADAPMPSELFGHVVRALAGTGLAAAPDPEEGRRRALALCREWRAQRRHALPERKGELVSAVKLANDKLIAAGPVPPPAPRPLPVTLEHFGRRRWKRAQDYRFAAADTLAPLTLGEAPQAMLSLPIVFVAQDGGYVPAALLGLEAKRNLLVGADGGWRGDYVPAAYQAYPFSLQPGPRGQQLLCFDVASGQAAEEEGEAFFAETGAAAPAVTAAADRLFRLQREQQDTRRACAALARHGVLEAWPVRVPTARGECCIDGLFRVAGAALDALPAAAFEELRRAGALQLAYCQQWSMPNLARLAALSAP
ncbi:MAG TPA: SapC family protein [Telluria sp.]|nr:SapC family protein [Telluria sp.]